jgi:hypothetical protein
MKYEKYFLIFFVKKQLYVINFSYFAHVLEEKGHAL